MITSEKVSEAEFSLIESMNESNLPEKIEYDITNNMIMFNISQYLDNIAKTFYSDNNKIIGQFMLDFPRSELYFNDSYIRDANVFIEKIKENFDYVSNYNNIKMYMMILMLCNQSGFGFPFTLMHKLYSNYKKGLYVVSNNIKYYINSKDDELTIELKGQFDIKNTFTNRVNSTINVNTKIDLILKNNEYIFPKLGIVYW
jgi:hypothetical protein